MTRTMAVLGAGAMLTALAFAPRAQAQDVPATTAAPPAAATPPPASPETASAASASTGSQGGLQFGLRLGYGIPMGKTADADGADLSNSVSGQLPIWLDVGYRIIPNIYVGLYGQYGIAFINKDNNTECKADGASCSASDFRFGVNAHYHFSPGQSVDPWVGLGIGYEIASTSFSSAAGDGSGSTKGFEFLNLQGGADFLATQGLGIGPFASFSLGQYGSSSATIGGQEISGDIEKTAMHEWLVIGVRGVYNL